MEERLKRIASHFNRPEENLGIAVTTMAFKNAKIINLLRKRGDHIKNERWDKQQEVEE